jgi:septal ring factor EnvC (AmiA/AmiB activator)
MKIRNPFGMLLLASLTVGVLAGCSRSDMTAEMRQQEADMNTDLTAWENDIDLWNTNNDRMRREHQDHTPKTGSALEKELAAHIEKLTEHQRNLDTFESSLTAHRTEVDEEAKRPERDRVLAHAGLWAKHQAIRASHASLAMTHEGLLDEHADLSTRLTAAR